MNNQNHSTVIKMWTSQIFFLRIRASCVDRTAYQVETGMRSMVGSSPVNYFSIKLEFCIALTFRQWLHTSVIDTGWEIKVIMIHPRYFWKEIYTHTISQTSESIIISSTNLNIKSLWLQYWFSVACFPYDWVTVSTIISRMKKKGSDSCVPSWWPRELCVTYT